MLKAYASGRHQAGINIVAKQNEQEHTIPQSHIKTSQALFLS
jgi:hypothetical protein